MEHRQFYDNTANYYDLRQDNPSVSYLRKHEKELIERFASGDSLDIGCGTGFHLQFLEKLKRDGTVIGNISGLDISKNMLLEAKKSLSDSVRLICTDAKKLPFADSSLDTVLCMNSTLNLLVNLIKSTISKPAPQVPNISEISYDTNSKNLQIVKPTSSVSQNIHGFSYDTNSKKSQDDFSYDAGIIPEMGRVVKKNGCVIISAASIWDKEYPGFWNKRKQLNSVKKSLRLHGEKIAVNLFSKQDLVELFEKNGFELEHFKGIFIMQRPYWGRFVDFTRWQKFKLNFCDRFQRYANAGCIYLCVFRKK